MSVIRVGSTGKYADGWEQIFGGVNAVRRGKAKAKVAARRSTKKKARGKVKARKAEAKKAFVKKTAGKKAKPRRR